MAWCAMSTETGALVPGGCSASWISRRSWDYRSIAQTGQPSEPCPRMRRIFIIAFAVALFAASAFTQRAQANGIVATWPVGHQPFGIAVDPSDGRVFVANSGATTNPTVSVVDPGTGSVTNLATSGTSDLVAVDSAARRLYSSNANGTLDVFDLSNGARVATVAVGAGVGVAVDPATRRVYVAGATWPLAAVDGVTNSVVATRSVPSGQVWFAVALDPGMHRVYVTNIDQTKPTLEVGRAHV